MPNAELAYKTLDLINANPQHFDMGNWFDGADLVGLSELVDNACGTTACFAGWALALTGHKLVQHGLAGVLAYKGDREVGPVFAVAADLLGLTESDANELFLDTADEEVNDAVAEIFGPRPGGDS